MYLYNVELYHLSNIRQFKNKFDNKYQDCAPIRKMNSHILMCEQHIFKKNSIITRSSIIDLIAENPNLIVKGNIVVNLPTGDALGIC